MMVMKQANWRTTSGCVYSTWYHVVWSTKYRYPVLVNTIGETAKIALTDLCAKHGYELKAIEVMPDHVHLFISIPPAQAVAVAVKLLKGASARTLLVTFPAIKKQLWGGHLWNPSYFVGTAGQVSQEIIQQYIERQKQNAIADD
jgi:putative transposase